MRAITFDIEAITPNFTRGRIDTSTLELTLVAIHDSETGQFSSYLKEELGQLWPIIERSDILIGYNSDAFDIPLLNRYYPGDLSKLRSLDLMVEVQKVLGRRLRLDSLAQATLGRGKSGDGLKAMLWWQEGKVDLVREYCIEDVRLTRELYDYAKQNGLVKYKDLKDIRDIKLNTSDWEKMVDDKSTLTHTLGL